MAFASRHVYDNITRLQWPNRLVVLARQDSALPMVSVRGSFRFGAASEPPVVSGRLKMLTALLRSGTETRNAVDLAQELDGMGSSVSFNVHHDAVHFTLLALTRHFEKTFEILTDMVFHSTFPETEVERIRKMMLADLKKKTDQPSVLAWEVFNHFVYGHHPYRRSLDGFGHSISSVTREDIRMEYRQRFLPSPVIIAMAGETDHLFNVIDASDWTQSRVAASLTTPDTPIPQQRRIIIVNRDLLQANICTGNLGSKRKSDDYHASLLMNYILGGSGLVSRLTHSIRTQQGLAYSVYSSMTKRLHGGTLSVHMQTKNESAGTAIRLIESEMRRMKEAFVGEQEWNDARLYFKGSFPFRLETNSNLAFYMEQSEFYDLGPDFLDREIEAIWSQTPSDIMTAARRYLHEDQSTVVIVGNKDRVLASLDGWGEVLDVDYSQLGEVT